MSKKALFIDRDGTIIVEPKTDFQVDTLEKLEFLPFAISQLANIAELDYELVMVSNQDGRGTESFPEEDFLLPQNKMLNILKNEGITFNDILIDNSFPEQNSPNRKPRTGMLTKYKSEEYNLSECYVIGDRLTDVELAKNLGAKAIFFTSQETANELFRQKPELENVCSLITNNWKEIYEFLRLGSRQARVKRSTRETQIELTIDLDGRGKSLIDTPFNFLNHMLDQIVHHAGVSLEINASGDTHIDDHHTIEDLGIVLGEAVYQALGNKLGIERYGFALPMDECDALVTLDFGGRIDFIWEVEFSRPTVGDVSTEMFEHFFKSFTQSALCNLHIRATGKNDHHLAEGVFKAFARTLRAAIKRNALNCTIPTSKGIL